MARRFAGQIANHEVEWANFTKGKEALKKDLAEQIGNFEVTWLESHFCKRFPKKPSKIFVNSMSDIAYWKKEWMNRVLARASVHPEHVFMFLTKSPAVYRKYQFPENCWLGVTATTTQEIFKYQYDQIGRASCRERV